MKSAAGLFFFLVLSAEASVLGATSPASTPTLEQASLDARLRAEARIGTARRTRELLQAGANVNATASYGETALLYAAQFGHTKLARVLIEWGANPELETEDLGQTPLIKAAEDGNWRMVEALLRAGANPNHANAFGRTPLIEASEGRNVRAVAVLLQLGGKRLDVRAEDGSGRSARDYALHPTIQSMLDRWLADHPSAPLRAAGLD